MYQYGISLQSNVYDSGNLLLLRGDIHKLLDAPKWVIYPKAVGVGAASETRLVFHLMDPSPQLRKLYHNVPLRETPGLCFEYLLARFAFTIFPRVGHFLRYQADRYMIHVKANAKGGKSELVTGSELARDYPAPGAPSSRAPSSSPSKRSRRESQMESQSPTKIQELDTYDQSGMQTRSHGQGTTLGVNPKKRRRSSVDPVQAAHRHDERAIPNPPKRIQRNRLSTGLSDDTCTCPHHFEPLTPGSAHGSRKSIDADDDPWRHFKACSSPNCLTRQERDRFKTLRASALHNERAKSGTEEWWTDMEAYRRRILERGGAISPREIKAWMWIEGAEFEEEGDVQKGELDFLLSETI